MADKAKFATNGRGLAAAMAILSDQIAAWRDVYWDRAYNEGGAEELTDQDVAAAGVTAADVTGMTTFADALDTFLASNRPYLSKMRNDL
jgi:hypothetical protein